MEKPGHEQTKLFFACSDWLLYAHAPLIPSCKQIFFYIFFAGISAHLVMNAVASATNILPKQIIRNI
ncbi:MAG: hypothetical protein A2583_03130 [Bdellovibrionales bacterium RIFOXYD1_FULL_53_11]|nr:MAG: hypothetical protein A2583_03130 [Bdellovibrionales bacterium RIFOXYD1_FULL_53_11]